MSDVKFDLKKLFYSDKVKQVGDDKKGKQQQQEQIEKADEESIEPGSVGVNDRDGSLFLLEQAAMLASVGQKVTASPLIDESIEMTPYDISGMKFSVGLSDDTLSGFTYKVEDNRIIFTGHKCVISIDEVDNELFEIEIFGSEVTLISNKKVKSITNNANKSIIYGSDYADNITDKSISSEIFAGKGDDVINASGSRTTIHGDDGNDTITAIGAYNDIEGNAGNDYINATGIGTKVDLGEETDSLYANGNKFQINSDQGSNQVAVRGSDNTITSGGETQGGKNSIVIDGQNNVVDNKSPSTDNITENDVPNPDYQAVIPEETFGKNGIVDGKMYLNDSLLTGISPIDDKMYKNGVPLTGVSETDGKLYNAGLLDTDKKVHDGKLYNNGTLATGVETIDGITYVNGIPQSSAHFWFDEDGKLWKDDKLYSGVYKQTLYKDGDVDIRKQIYGGKLWVDGTLSKGIDHFEGKTYYYGSIAQGDIGDQTYRDGILIREKITNEDNSSTVKNYDESGKILAEKNYNSSDKITSMKFYTYSQSGELIKTVEQNNIVSNNGNPISFTEIITEGTRTPVESEISVIDHYSADGSARVVYSKTINSNTVYYTDIDKTLPDISNKLTGTPLYTASEIADGEIGNHIFKNGKIDATISYEKYDGTDTIKSKTIAYANNTKNIINYDDKGLKTTERWFNTKNQLTYIATYKNDGETIDVKQNAITYDNSTGKIIGLDEEINGKKYSIRNIQYDNDKNTVKFLRNKNGGSAYLYTATLPDDLLTTTELLFADKTHLTGMFNGNFYNNGLLVCTESKYQLVESVFDKLPAPKPDVNTLVEVNDNTVKTGTITWTDDSPLKTDNQAYNFTFKAGKIENVNTIISGKEYDYKFIDETIIATVTTENKTDNTISVIAKDTDNNTLYDIQISKTADFVSISDKKADGAKINFKNNTTISVVVEDVVRTDGDYIKITRKEGSKTYYLTYNESGVLLRKDETGESNTKIVTSYTSGIQSSQRVYDADNKIISMTFYASSKTTECTNIVVSEGVLVSYTETQTSGGTATTSTINVLEHFDDRGTAKTIYTVTQDGETLYHVGEEPQLPAFEDNSVTQIYAEKTLADGTINGKTYSHGRITSAEKRGDRWYIGDDICDGDIRMPDGSVTTFDEGVIIKNTKEHDSGTTIKRYYNNSDQEFSSILDFDTHNKLVSMKIYERKGGDTYCTEQKNFQYDGTNVKSFEEITPDEKNISYEVLSRTYGESTDKIVVRTITEGGETKYSVIDNFPALPTKTSENPAILRLSGTALQGTFDGKYYILGYSTPVDYSNAMIFLDSINYEYINALIPTAESGLSVEITEELCSNLKLPDTVKSDIEILKTADTAANTAKQAAIAEGKTAEEVQEIYQTTFDNSIASQMVKDYKVTEKTDEVIFSETHIGDVIEKADGIYVNDGSQLYKLGMSKEKYLEFFPPLKRYASQQQDIPDCYFISSILSNSMKNPQTYAQLLKMFSVDEANNVKITFRGDLADYEVTFPSGHLFEMTNKQTDGCMAAKYLEQAYALANYAEIHKIPPAEIGTININTAFTVIVNGGLSVNNIIQNSLAKQIDFGTVDSGHVITKSQITSLENEKFTNSEAAVKEFLEYKIDFDQKQYDIYAGIDGYTYNALVVLSKTDDTIWYNSYQGETPSAYKFRCTLLEKGLGELDQCLTDEQICSMIAKVNALSLPAGKTYKDMLNEYNSKLSTFSHALSSQFGTGNPVYALMSLNFGSSTVVDSEHISNLNRILSNINTDGFKKAMETEAELNCQPIYNAFASYAEALERGEIALDISAVANDDGSHYIVANHAYSVEKIDTENKTIQIVNPWKCGLKFEISYEDFTKYFTATIGYTQANDVINVDNGTDKFGRLWQNKKLVNGTIENKTYENGKIQREITTEDEHTTTYKDYTNDLYNHNLSAERTFTDGVLTSQKIFTYNEDDTVAKTVEQKDILFDGEPKKLKGYTEVVTVDGETPKTRAIEIIDRYKDTNDNDCVVYTVTENGKTSYYTSFEPIVQSQNPNMQASLIFDALIPAHGTINGNVYDLGNLVKSHNQDGTFTVNTYDANRNMTTTRTHDANGNLTAITKYEYNDSGSLTRTISQTNITYNAVTGLLKSYIETATPAGGDAVTSTVNIEEYFYVEDEHENKYKKIIFSKISGSEKKYYYADEPVLPYVSTETPSLMLQGINEANGTYNYVRYSNGDIVTPTYTAAQTAILNNIVNFSSTTGITLDNIKNAVFTESKGYNYTFFNCNGKIWTYRTKGLTIELFETDRDNNYLYYGENNVEGTAFKETYIDNGYYSYLAFLSSLDKTQLSQYVNIALLQQPYAYSFQTDFNLTPNVQSDIDMLMEANKNVKTNMNGSLSFGQAVSNEYTKDYSGKSVPEILSLTQTGDVFTKDSKLYVNDGTDIRELQISPEKYYELFPPVGRYTVNQGGYGDCYFISGALLGCIGTAEAYAQVLQMFSVDDATGNITITFKGLPQYPVTFPNGEPFAVPDEPKFLSGSKASVLIEQAYALAQFAYDSERTIMPEDLDIAEAMYYIGNGGFNDEAQNAVLGSNVSDITFMIDWAGMGEEYVNNNIHFYTEYLANENLVFEKEKSIGLEDYSTTSYMEDVRLLSCYYGLLYETGNLWEDCMVDGKPSTSKIKDILNYYYTDPDLATVAEDIDRIAFVLDSWPDDFKVVANTLKEHSDYITLAYNYEMSDIDWSEKFPARLEYITKYQVENQEAFWADVEARGFYQAITTVQNNYVDEFTNSLTAGSIILSSSTPSDLAETPTEDDLYISAGHAYVIWSVDKENKKVTITNPWGGGLAVNISYDDLTKYFSQIFIAPINSIPQKGDLTQHDNHWYIGDELAEGSLRMDNGSVNTYKNGELLRTTTIDNLYNTTVDYYAGGDKSISLVFNDNKDVTKITTYENGEVKETDEFLYGGGNVMRAIKIGDETYDLTAYDPIRGAFLYADTDGLYYTYELPWIQDVNATSNSTFTNISNGKKLATATFNGVEYINGVPQAVNPTKGADGLWSIGGNLCQGALLLQDGSYGTYNAGVLLRNERTNAENQTIVTYYTENEPTKASTFDENGKIIKIETFDGEGNPTVASEFTWEGDIVTSVSEGSDRYDRENYNTSSRQVIFATGGGETEVHWIYTVPEKPLKTILSNDVPQTVAEGKTRADGPIVLTDGSTNTYDNGTILRNTKLDGSNEVLTYYNNGIKNIETTYNSSGQLTQIVTYKNNGRDVDKTNIFNWTSDRITSFTENETLFNVTFHETDKNRILYAKGSGEDLRYYTYTLPTKLATTEKEQTIPQNVDAGKILANGTINGVTYVEGIIQQSREEKGLDGLWRVDGELCQGAIPQENGTYNTYNQGVLLRNTKMTYSDTTITYYTDNKKTIETKYDSSNKLTRIQAYSTDEEATIVDTFTWENGAITGFNDNGVNRNVTFYDAENNSILYAIGTGEDLRYYTYSLPANINTGVTTQTIPQVVTQSPETLANGEIGGRNYIDGVPQPTPEELQAESRNQVMNNWALGSTYQNNATDFVYNDNNQLTSFKILNKTYTVLYDGNQQIAVTANNALTTVVYQLKEDENFVQTLTNTNFDKLQDNVSIYSTGTSTKGTDYVKKGNTLAVELPSTDIPATAEEKEAVWNIIEKYINKYTDMSPTEVGILEKDKISVFNVKKSGGNIVSFDVKNNDRYFIDNLVDANKENPTSITGVIKELSVSNLQTDGDNIMSITFSAETLCNNGEISSYKISEDYTYDEKNRVSRTIQSTEGLYSDDNFYYTITTDFTYDDKDRVIRNVSQYNGSTSYTITNNYTYDDKDRVETMISTQQITGSYTTTITTNYTYDSNDRVKTEVTSQNYTVDEQTYTLTSSTEYTYNTNDRITKEIRTQEISYNLEGTPYTSTSTIDYVYDTNTNLLTEKTTTSSTSTSGVSFGSTTTTESYTYTAGILTSTHIETQSTTLFSPTPTTTTQDITYTYDENGYLLKEVSTGTNDSAIYENRYIYNEKGDRIKYLHLEYKDLLSEELAQCQFNIDNNIDVATSQARINEIIGMKKIYLGENSYTPISSIDDIKNVLQDLNDFLAEHKDYTDMLLSKDSDLSSAIEEFLSLFKDFIRKNPDKIELGMDANSYYSTVANGIRNFFEWGNSGRTESLTNISQESVFPPQLRQAALNLLEMDKQMKYVEPTKTLFELESKAVDSAVINYNRKMAELKLADLDAKIKELEAKPNRTPEEETALNEYRQEYLRQKADYDRLYINDINTLIQTQDIKGALTTDTSKWHTHDITIPTYLDIVDKNTVTPTPSPSPYVSRTLNSAEFVKDSTITPSLSGNLTPEQITALYNSDTVSNSDLGDEFFMAAWREMTPQQRYNAVTINPENNTVTVNIENILNNRVSTKRTYNIADLEQITSIKLDYTATLSDDRTENQIIVKNLCNDNILAKAIEMSIIDNFGAEIFDTEFEYDVVWKYMTNVPTVRVNGPSADWERAIAFIQEDITYVIADYNSTTGEVRYYNPDTPDDIRVSNDDDLSTYLTTVIQTVDKGYGKYDMRDFNWVSPLVFDVNGNGIETTDEIISYDIDGDGKKEKINNVNDMVLVFDANHNGIIGENGKELFGTSTDLDNNGIADGFKNGFEALEAVALKYGLLSETDRVLDTFDLRILQDVLGLRMKQGYLGQTYTFDELGITQINIPSSSQISMLNNFDNKGNNLMLQENATFIINGEVCNYADIWHKIQK